MRHSDVRSQLDTAFGNVESALRHLSDRLDDVLPDYGRRRKMSRAGRAIRRTASSVADRVLPRNTPSLMEDTRRTVREHPVGTVLTAALAGYCVWSLLRAANARHGRLTTDDGRTLAGRLRAAQEGALRH